MRRTSFVTGIIFPALAALLGACGGTTPKCLQQETECLNLCTDTGVDNQNCGACGNVCAADQVCTSGQCLANCTLPEVACENVCTDTQTSTAHCGVCGTACTGQALCRAGKCAAPLAVMQTSLNDRATDRDLFVLEDVTLDLTQIDHATFASSRVVNHAVLPDGSLLLVAAEDTEGTFELYHASPHGGTLTKLNPTLPAGATLQPEIAISKDGTKVLYRANQDSADTVELYVVTIAKPGVAAKVNGPLIATGQVSRVIAISDDGSRAAYVAEEDSATVFEAYVVDLSGATPGASVKLNAATTSGVWDLVMTGDGKKIVYRVQDPVSNQPELYEVDVATPGVAHLIVNPDGTNGHVEGYRLTADGTAVLYTGSVPFLEESLWRAPLTAPYDSVLLVSGGMGNTPVRADFVATRDGMHVYFRQHDTMGIDKLNRVDVAMPGVLTMVSLTDETILGKTTDFVLSADEHSIVFRAGADGAEGGNPQPGTNVPPVDNRFAPTIYEVDLTQATPTPVLLSPPLTTGEGIDGDYIVTADGQRTLYRADQDTVGHSEVYLVKLATPGVVTKVSPPLDGTNATDVSVLSGF